MKQAIIFLGILIIFGATSELIKIISDYFYGKLSLWPKGAEIGLLGVFIIGFILIRKGMRTKN